MPGNLSQARVPGQVGSRLWSAAVKRIDVVPVAIGRCQVNRARGTECARFTERLTALCAEMGTEVLASDELLTIPVAPMPGHGHR